jgi:MoxR-like ATPase
MDRTAMDPDRFAEVVGRLESEIRRVIVGQDDVVRTVLICLLTEGHVLLEGVPGLGKTQLLRTLSEAMTLEFSRIQFTPDLMPADIVGTQVLADDDAGRRRFEFRSGPVFANLVLADEVNRASPKTQSALLEAMQERQVTVAGATRPLPRPFLVMATQNPLEMEGTYPLPEAQLDRFLLKAIVRFPSAEQLAEILERTTTGADPTVEAVADTEQLTAMIGLVRQVPVASHLVRHATDLVVATHPDHPSAPELVRRYVRYGSSPRGAQALVLAAKAVALLDGRPNVAAEDIRSVALPALRHRLVLGYEAVADGVPADQAVEAVIDAVPLPTSGLRGAP